ncbi:RHS repeat-associated core domain-containing protein [Acidovorax sp. NCPPB 3576]|uniref:RHS repeat-associated core domain-containing protein n=1 Tax=Acidovorax sp. NCPPB 3576 TaxID=2940488 RepID=UPI00234A1949|nr:RHS repeat-associated core domain-containing protein [Acidovorax sp. NCPPB 3576]WCM87852.1 hypothetical protein M5C98_21315 [Acidovorax sp. NCPPB 3576]
MRVVWAACIALQALGFLGHQDGVGDRLVSSRLQDTYQKTYLYEDTGNPFLLTALVDENGSRFAQFSYDALGRTLKAAHAGDALAHQFDYTDIASGQVGVKDPLGQSRRYGYTVQNKALAVTSASSAPGLAYRPVNRRVQNAAGLVTAETDFLGRQTTYEWDNDRQLPLLATHAKGTAQERRVATQWHPTYRLPVKVTDGNRVTEYTYDADGNVLTERVYDASQPDGAAKAAVRRWEYQGGQVTAEIDALGVRREYTYHSNTPLVFESTDPFGRRTSHHYSDGRLVSKLLPNGLLTEYAHGDPRGLLNYAWVLGLAWTYQYNAIGKLSRSTQPDGYQIDYAYDSAHRLASWKDNRGASGSYGYDLFNNVILQEVKDAAGQTVWRQERGINAANQLETVKAGNQVDRYAYGPNGERLAAENALGQRYRYATDPLGRVAEITDPLGKVASLSYDGLGAVQGAKDFAGVATAYANDIRGNATRETSADSGAVTVQYDALGRPTQVSDALARTTGLTRDAAGRLTRILWKDGKQSVWRYDLTGASYNAPGTPQASIGSLSEIQDAGVTTRWQRDPLGRVTARTQVLANGDSRTLAQAYVPAGPGGTSGAGAGQIATLTYASGKKLQYQYDATGQLTGLQWNGQPLLTAITWNPLGQPTGWKWPAFGLTEQRSYTLAGQLSASRLLPHLAWDSAGRLAQVQQRHALRGATGAQQAVITSANTYDATGRLTASAHSAPAGLTLPTGSALSDTLGANTSGYAWDANGNRSQSHYSSTTAAGTATLKRSYIAVSGSNRLQNYTQTFQPTSGSAQTSTVAYSHDATGSLTKKGDNYLHYGSDGRIAKAGLNADPANTLAVSYTYNALGQRVFKSDARLSGANNPAITTQTVYAEDGIGSTVLGQYGNRRSSNSAAPAGEMDSTEVIYLPTASGPMPVAAQINGRLYAIDADHLNTPRRLTNTQGQVVWQWLITGFGEANPTTGATGYAQSGQGATNYSEAVKFDLRYPGQVWDEETGLAYNLNRYYDREGGRYIQADPIGLEGGWNRFLYVGGNPASYTDPTGEFAIAIPFIPAIITGADIAIGTGLGALGYGLDRIFNRPKNPPDVGPPGGFVQGPNRGRDYCPDGSPQTDYDRPHQGAQYPHIHDWSDGKRDDHAGRPYSPWPAGNVPADGPFSPFPR